jgi:hypothetical protein
MLMTWVISFQDSMTVGTNSAGASEPMEVAVCIDQSIGQRQAMTLVGMAEVE